MPTTVRGFVQRIEVGRAGLVTITLVEMSGAVGLYIIQDLDADPERFNERLSKLGILRDAMNRAEPVEIQWDESESGRAILQVARITRDEIDPNQTVRTVSGFVLGLMLQSQNGDAGSSEMFDMAYITLISPDMTTLSLELNMQIPERHVASHLFDLLNEALKSGTMTQITYIMEDDNTRRGRIMSVMPYARNTGTGADLEVTLDGFVETLSLIPVGGVAVGTLAHVRFTTTLPFIGDGNTVGLTPFIPETVDLFVARGSLAYDLFEAGLRDNLRMRVTGLNPRQRQPDQPNEPDENTPGRPVPQTAVDEAANIMSREEPATVREISASTRLLAIDSAANLTRRRVETGVEARTLYLVTGAELLAPLASASRPVWVMVSRETLEYGPEKLLCTPGTPTSDLTPRSLRDLRIPYPAVWLGVGCFNGGVYRFQFNLPTTFRVMVDGEELCLYDTEAKEVKVAHACLGGEHEVRVELDDWLCDYKFTMDVYRIR